jgi:hypothetical protein
MPPTKEHPLRPTTYAVAALAAVSPIPAIVPVLPDPQPAAPAAAPAVTTPLPLPTVVRTVVRKPQRVMTMRSPFRPPAFPSASYVFDTIAPYEARKWNVSLDRLRGRIDCESDGWWWKTNGQYAGVGQFAASTFARGVASIGVRRVAVANRRVRERRTRIIEVMSDGTKRVRYGKAIRQRIVHLRVGKLPRNPPHRHAWAQVRIMAQAMAGRSGVNDSEWACR